MGFRLSDGKTGSREVGVGLLMQWAFASGYLFFWIDHDQVKDYTSIYATFSTAVFAFAMGAFGLEKLTQAGAFGQSSAPAPRVPLKGGDKREID